MSRLDLESVSKVFPGGTMAVGLAAGGTMANGTVAVRGLSLSVADGELLALVGPSGCGKTTTLRLIAGLEQPSEGRVSMGGRDVSGVSPDRRDVAMVFARGALYPHWTVWRNLICGAQWRAGAGASRRWAARWLWRWGAENRRSIDDGRDPAALDQAAHQVAEQLGLGELLNRYPAELSDGQRQRVALGRAMVRRPSLYLMDEPLTGLDEPRRRELRWELKQWQAAARATVVYVTHDQTEALLLGDRVAVMNEGELQQVGTAQQVYEQPSNRFVAGFIGEPAMNFVTGHLAAAEASGQKTPEKKMADEKTPSATAPGTFCGGGWSVPVAGGPNFPRYAGEQVVLGIRPEHIRVSGVGGSGRGTGDGETTDRGQAGLAQDQEIAGRIDGVESACGRHVVYVTPAHGTNSRGPSQGVKPEAESAMSAPCDRWAVRWDEEDVRRHGRPRAGGDVRLSLDARHVLVFDGATGVNLTLPESP